MKQLLNFKAKPDFVAFLLRISIGSMFFLHAVGKILVVGMGVVDAGFIERGFPVWTNYAATSIELIGGLCLILGLYSRLSALLLFPISIGILVFHFPMGWAFQNPGGGWEYPQLILSSLICIFFLGSGRYAIVKPKSLVE